MPMDAVGHAVGMPMDAVGSDGRRWIPMDPVGRMLGAAGNQWNAVADVLTFVIGDADGTQLVQLGSRWYLMDFNGRWCW